MQSGRMVMLPASSENAQLMGNWIVVDYRVVVADHICMPFR